MKKASCGKIIIAGDFFPVDENESFFCKGDIDTLLGDRLCQLFFDADLSVCNLEGALSDHNERCNKTGPVKVAPTKCVETYKSLGINCCMLANNHATDGGHQGLISTIDTLDRYGIDHIGAGKNKDSISRFIIYDVAGMKIGFYNVCETMYNKPTESQAGAWLYDEYVVCHELEDYRKKCDYLIVIYHGGTEKFRYPSPQTKKRFHRMADSGADMILSQHTHCIGSEEHYNGAYLLYGQGNFLFNNYAPTFTGTGIVVEIDIVDKEIKIIKHKVTSVGRIQVRYSDDQDFSDFYERSSRIDDDEYIYQQFQKYCNDELHLYLKAFKSPGRIADRILDRLPKSFKRWLFTKTHTNRDLLFSLHTLRSEQNREIAIRGIEDLLEKKTGKRIQ